MNMGAIAEWIEAGGIGYRSVATIEGVAALDTYPVSAFPACLVVQATETMTPSQEGAGLIVIERTIAFDVVSIVSTSARRGKDQADLAALSDATILRLLGWTPDAAVYRPIVPVAGQLLGLAGGRASWLTRFRTLDRLRKQG